MGKKIPDAIIPVIIDKFENQNYSITALAREYGYSKPMIQTVIPNQLIIDKAKKMYDNKLKFTNYYKRYLKGEALVNLAIECEMKYTTFVTMMHKSVDVGAIYNELYPIEKKPVCVEPSWLRHVPISIRFDDSEVDEASLNDYILQMNDFLKNEWVK